MGSGGAAKDCRRLRRFLPPRCFLFFVVEDVGASREEATAADGFDKAAWAYKTAAGFDVGSEAAMDGFPCGFCDDD